MKIGGFQKTSLKDYPGKISSIIFTIGCNFRCPFCYVPELVLPEKIKEIKEISEASIFSYLRENKKFIDAVVITGGEPTLQPDLITFIRKVKSMNFLVALETNGTNPSIIQTLINDKLVDYVEVDVKTRLVFKKYNEIVGNVLTREMFENIKNTIKLLIDSNVNYEFRTTICKEYHSTNDILSICKFIKGAKVYYIQNVRNPGDLIGGRKLTSFSDKEIKKIIEKGKKFVNIVYREQN